MRKLPNEECLNRVCSRRSDSSSNLESSSLSPSSPWWWESYMSGVIYSLDQCLYKLESARRLFLEAWVKKKKYLLKTLPTYAPIHLPTCLPTCLPASLPARLLPIYWKYDWSSSWWPLCAATSHQTKGDMMTSSFGTGISCVKSSPTCPKAVADKVLLSERKGHQILHCCPYLFFWSLCVTT